MLLTVQFSDSTPETIVTYFSSPQNGESFANLGTVDTTDARWKAFYDSLSTDMHAGLPAPG